MELDCDVAACAAERAELRMRVTDLSRLRHSPLDRGRQSEF